jgi:hypothetical protein
MLSLAPFLYRNVFTQDGGPIERIQSGTIPVFNEPRVQANAYLKPGLIEGKAPQSVYGNADGTGASKNAVVAQHMAISEALERWALYAVNRSDDRSKYGFNHDRSSNGMAAFPGFKWQARRRARLEALERWAMIGWWDGRLKATVSQAPAPYPNVGIVRIEHGQGDGEVVVLFHKSPAGYVAYGHAAGSTVMSATSKAVVELARSEFVLTRHRARGALVAVTNFFERRCLHFSTPEGHSEFLDRAHTPPDKPAPVWKTIYDGEIVGPWSKWTTVWRHCVEMPTHDFLNRDKNFFFW